MNFVNIVTKLLLNVKGFVLNKQLHSYHTFMFPFRFDRIIKTFTDRHGFYKELEFDKRISIKQLIKGLKNHKWEYKKFEIKDNYNEWVYFYDFVRDALYNKKEIDNSATSYYFEKDIPEDAKYIIKVKGNTPYELELKSITLRIFDTGVGILAFELENYKYNKLKDIFNINEYGRRIYPQFIGKNGKSIDTKEVFLAEYLEVNGILEEFCGEYEDIKLSNTILETLGGIFTTEKDRIGDYYIQPIIDDRMFVVSHILNNVFSEDVKSILIDTHIDDEEKAKQINETENHWYEYLFMDKYNVINIQNEEMKKDLLKKHTYIRWQGYGTLYGASRYSFVVLSNKSGFSDYLLQHVKTVYFQIVTLVLANRASLLRFSDEITALSDIESKNKQNLVDKISNLYKNYLRYKNKLYFKEVTAQEQGIELYDLLKKVTRIDSDIKDLSGEIDSLHNYAYMLQEKEEKEEMALLTKLGAIFLPPTLLAGMFGMNYIDFAQHNPVWSLVATATIIFSAFMGYIMVEKTKYKATKIVIMAIMLFVFGALVYSYPINNSKDLNTTKMPQKLQKELEKTGIGKPYNIKKENK